MRLASHPATPPDPDPHPDPDPDPDRNLDACRNDGREPCLFDLHDLAMHACRQALRARRAWQAETTVPMPECRQGFLPLDFAP